MLANIDKKVNKMLVNIFDDFFANRANMLANSFDQHVGSNVGPVIGRLKVDASIYANN